MVIVEHENIELDYCTNCKGVWFDSGELELLLEAAELENYEVFLDRIIDFQNQVRWKRNANVLSVIRR